MCPQIKSTSGYCNVFACISAFQNKGTIAQVLVAGGVLEFPAVFLLPLQMFKEWLRVLCQRSFIPKSRMIRYIINSEMNSTRVKKQNDQVYN